MEVIVLSEKKQSFNGVTYYLCGSYFQKKGVRLHREVWKYHNGEIPKGYHVHHKDHDRSNNDISNLALKTKHEHLHEHSSEAERVEYSKLQIERIRPLACAWHGSEKGREWHSKQGKENYKKRTLTTYICTCCGKEFQTLHVYGKNVNHFCHQNCKARYRRELIKKGVIVK